ncbi:MAG: nitroreductase family protein [Synergistaceae bacterium]
MIDNSNPAIDNILARRSIRRFNEKLSIKQAEIECLLECASAAPSAHNLKPFHFIVLTKKEKLNYIAKIHPHAKMLATAPLAIVVCGELERDGEKLDYWEHDCAAAMENLLLAATALRLGSVWIGVRHSNNNLEDKIKTVLEIPNSIGVLAIAAIGHPLETKDPHKGIIPTSLHVNKW